MVSAHPASESSSQTAPTKAGWVTVACSGRLAVTALGLNSTRAPAGTSNASSSSARCSAARSSCGW